MSDSGHGQRLAAAATAHQPGREQRAAEEREPGGGNHDAAGGKDKQYPRRGAQWLKEATHGSVSRQRIDDAQPHGAQRRRQADGEADE